MGLLKKLKMPIVAGSLLLSLSYALPARSDGLSDIKTDEEVISFALATRTLLAPSVITDWRDENGKIKGKSMLWDFNEDGNYELIMSYEFISSPIKNTGKGLFRILERSPSEIFFNRVDRWNYDTTNGDVYLKRNGDGEYKRKRHVGSEKKT